MDAKFATAILGRRVKYGWAVAVRCGADPWPRTSKQGSGTRGQDPPTPFSGLPAALGLICASV